LFDNLRWAAERAERPASVLLLESVDSARLPTCCCTITGRQRIAGLSTPAVRLIFDTGHVQAMDGDVVRQLEAPGTGPIVHWRYAGLRLEPGSARSTSPPCWCAETATLRGLVELEFAGRARDRDEQAFIERLRRLDAPLTNWSPGYETSFEQLAHGLSLACRDSMVRHHSRPIGACATLTSGAPNRTHRRPAPIGSCPF